jgi:hypothetical protein
MNMKRGYLIIGIIRSHSSSNRTISQQLRELSKVRMVTSFSLETIATVEVLSDKHQISTVIIEL